MGMAIAGSASDKAFSNALISPNARVLRFARNNSMRVSEQAFKNEM
jgi:hypothetical protein